MTDLQTPARGAYMVLALCCLTLIATIFLRTCPAVLVPDLVETFKVTPAEVALLSSATLLAYGLMQMPGGLITDAIGGRNTLTMFLVLASVATLIFAFAPSLEAGIAARFVKGFTLAAFPAIAATLSRYFPANKYTMAVGIVMGMGTMGSLLSAEPLARLSNALGWRYAMAVSALMVLALGVMVFILIKPGAKSTAQKESFAAGFKRIWKNMLKVFATKEFWFLTGWQLCTASSFFAFATMWAGPYLMDAYSLTKIEASRILLWQVVGSLALVPLIGVFADLINSRRIAIIICSVLGLIGSLGLACFAGKLSQPLLICSIMFCGSFSSGGATCVFSLINRNFPKEMTGTGTGCVNMFWPMGASALSVIIGAVVNWLAGAKGGMAVLDAAAKAGVYGNAMLIAVALWVVALILGLFFIKEDFVVKS